MFELSVPDNNKAALSKYHLAAWLGTMFQISSSDTLGKDPKDIIDKLSEARTLPTGLKHAGIVYEKLPVRGSIATLKPSYLLYQWGLDFGHEGSVIVADSSLKGIISVFLCVFCIDSNPANKGAFMGSTLQQWHTVTPNPVAFTGGYKDVSIIALQMASLKK